MRGPNRPKNKDQTQSEREDTVLNKGSAAATTTSRKRAVSTSLGRPQATKDSGKETGVDKEKKRPLPLFVTAPRPGVPQSQSPLTLASVQRSTPLRVDLTQLSADMDDGGGSLSQQHQIPGITTTMKFSRDMMEGQTFGSFSRSLGRGSGFPAEADGHGHLVHQRHHNDHRAIGGSEDVADAAFMEGMQLSQHRPGMLLNPLQMNGHVDLGSMPPLMYGSLTKCVQNIPDFLSFAHCKL
jgi:hypothetical protein